MSAAHNRKSVEAIYVPAILAEFPKLPDEAYISVRSVAALFDAGVSTIWARVKRNELPAPKKFGRSTRWNVGAIRAVLAGGAE